MQTEPGLRGWRRSEAGDMDLGSRAGLARVISSWLCIQWLMLAA